MQKRTRLYRRNYRLEANLKSWIRLIVFLLVSLCLCLSRIYEILPQRIQQWQQSPCVAEEMGRRQLERIRREQQAARLRLTMMEKRFHELEGIIANAKLQQVQHHEEVHDSQRHLSFLYFILCT